jgi:DNA-nicking Smr family endonuclease
MSGSRKPADPGPRRRAPTDIAPDDAALWEKVAATAKPLPAKKRAAAAKPKIAAPDEPAAPAMPRKAAVPAAPPVSAPAAKPRDLEAGAAIDLDRRTAERLKRGQLPLDGRIDLHGMTQDDAHAALNRFIAASRAMGRRCVLVITGKGRASGEARGEIGGVLKRAVPRWLNEPGLRAQILAFAGAQPKDGGGGALYVLLKRIR